jgi:hypothetical protein
MATTYYMSIDGNTTSPPSYEMDVDHRGTSSTAADIIELRMGNGTYAPDRMECILACRRFIRELQQGGLNQAGANLPLPSGTGG